MRTQTKTLVTFDCDCSYNLIPAHVAQVDQLRAAGKPVRCQMHGDMARGTLTPEGIYSSTSEDGTRHYVRIVLNKARTSSYAKQLTFAADLTPSWQYAAHLGRTLPASYTRLSYEEAAEFGFATNYCIACAAPLTDTASIARGMGPVCAVKLQ